MSARFLSCAFTVAALLLVSRGVDATRIVILPESHAASAQPRSAAFAEVMETFEEAPIDPLTPPRRWEGSGDDDDGLASQVPKYLVANTTFNDASAPSDSDPIPPCASSSCLPPPKGLVGFWPGDGNGDDVVGYSGDPSFSSFTGPGVSYETGKVGPAFEFYSHKSINLGNAPELRVGGLGAGMTVEFWIQFRRLDTDIPIIEKSITDHGVGTPVEEPSPFAAAGVVPKAYKIGNTNTDGWRVFYNKDDQMIWFCMGHHIGGCPVDGDDRAAPLVRTRQTQLTTNTWYHVAAVKTTGDLYLYLNGRVEDHKEIDDLSLVNTNKAASLLIGASAAPYPKPGPYLDGFMDEVSLYSRALSPEELSAIINKAGAGKCKCLAPLVPKLAAWWPGDGHAGDLVAVDIGHEFGKDFSHNSGPSATFSSFSSPRDGKVKQAFFFDGNLAMTFGNGAQVHIGGPGAEFSVNLWVRFSALPESQHAPDVPILEKMTAVSPLASDGWRIYRHGRTRAIGFCIGTTISQKDFDALPKNFVRNAFFPVCDPANSRNNTIFTTSNIETDVWYHVAVVRTLTDISIYLDGTLQESKAIAASSVLDTNQAELLAGTHSMVDSSIAIAQGDSLLLDRRRRAIRPHYLHGFLDEIQLHRRALSRLDVRLAFEADSRGQCKEVRCKKGYIRLYYNLPEARAVYATIHNRSGVVVRRIPKIAGKLGLNYLLWDGKDDLGKKVDRKDRPYVARVWQKETQRLVDTVRIPLKTRKYTCADQ